MEKLEKDNDKKIKSNLIKNSIPTIITFIL